MIVSASFFTSSPINPKANDFFPFIMEENHSLLFMITLSLTSVHTKLNFYTFEILKHNTPL